MGNRATIHWLRGGTFRRVIHGGRMFKKCYMGFVRMENKWSRVYLHGTTWYEHPTDWRCYDSITDARIYDDLYDVNFDDGLVY